MPDFLPKEFRNSHEYCFFLHDQMVETLKSGEKAQIFDIQVEFKDERHPNEIEGLSSEEFIDWLENHSYKEDVYLLYYKQVVAALLSDFLHFVYEALESSRKGKLTVSYALLRKPFKENLFYFEWLLADPRDFLSRFNSERNNRFSFPTDVSRERKIELIRKAMKNTRYENWLDAEFLYELRYNKSAPFGMEALWQKANHLFTSFRYMETEKCNFNFVFSNEEAHYSQWEQIYSFLPILLFHAVQVVEAIIDNFAKRAHADADITPLRTSIGMLLWMQDGPWKVRIPNLESEIEKILKDTDLKCPHCGKTLDLGQEGLERLYLNGSIQCTVCGEKESLIHEP